MNNKAILKRLYKDYTKKYLNKILISVFFSTKKTFQQKSETLNNKLSVLGQAYPY